MPLPFPNVPFAPGVPSIPRSVLFPPSATPQVGTQASQGVLWQASQASPVWGVFDSDGNQVLDPDSVLEFGIHRDSSIPNFPIQEGSFASYNKVVLPYEVPLRFSKGGSQSDRTQFLMDIEALYQSLDLYTVMTPEIVYPNLNLQRYEITRRGAEGAFFLTDVDCYFIQILTVQPQYTTTPTTTSNGKNPSSQPPTNAGTVYPQQPSAALAGMGTTALGNTFFA